MAALTDSPALTSEALEALIARLGEPDWLAEERRAAWRTYQQTPFPTGKDELWRYSELPRFALGDLEPAGGPRDERVSDRIRMRITDSDAEGTLVFKAGELVHRDRKLEQAGVVFTDLRSAVREHEALVREHLYSVVNAGDGAHKYAALNAAFWTNGTFLYVPKDVEVELPLGAITTSDRGGLTGSRTLIVVERNAKVTFLDEYTSDPIGERLMNTGATEIVLRDGAKLRYVNLQNWSREVVQMNTIRAHLARDARLESLTVSLGGDAARTEVEVSMRGPGSESEMLGLYFADEGQHYNQYTVQHHAADHAHSDLLFKGALRDASSAVYSGVIIVDPGAQKTDAYQTNRNLLLDRESEAVSIPQLEIKANDVRCSHGSTTGPVPEDQRFYLMSRGLRPEVAEHVLVTGFLYEVMSRVTLPKVAEYVERVVQAKLGVPGVKEKL
ncbi:MAG: Fe-S cluster assembly protein SufD [Nocardiopsis sp. BM-2018]|nr:MAG: Fe-S cluster assembly protein SufD [Nocardiopsis sp. BM-2018]